jgi:hypothetical protein
MPISTSANSNLAGATQACRFPTETEIYILPDGRVVVADLPAELSELVAQLGLAEPCEIAPASTTGDAARRAHPDTA